MIQKDQPCFHQNKHPVNDNGLNNFYFNNQKLTINVAVNHRIYGVYTVSCVLASTIISINLAITSNLDSKLIMIPGRTRPIGLDLGKKGIVR